MKIPTYIVKFTYWDDVEQETRESAWWRIPEVDLEYFIRILLFNRLYPFEVKLEEADAG